MSKTLYWGSGSGPCWRVMISLAEKGIEYESKLLEFSKQQHKSPEILELNPRGQLPTFVDGDMVLKESLATLVYLEETYPSVPLLPKDPAARALVWQRFFELSNFGDKIREPRMMIMRNLIKTEDDEKVFAEKVELVKKELSLWEGYLAASGGPFLTGADFTIADAAFGPDLLSAQRFGAKFADFPHVKKYVEALSARPSVASTEPPHWKDSKGREELSVI